MKIISNALFALDYITQSIGKEQALTMPSYFNNIKKALRHAERESKRMDWLLEPGKDMGVRNDNGTGTYFDTRRQIDAAIRASKPRKEKR